MNFNFSFINLGCTKNLVDTQILLGKIFSLAGNNPNYQVQYFADAHEKEVEYVFLNTCGFISSWREEMFAVLEELLEDNKIVYLIWCWLQYFKLSGENRDPREVEDWEYFTKNPKVHLLSWPDWDNITILDLIKGFDSKIFKNEQKIGWDRAYTNAQYRFEYLKIAEWCNNSCSFCIIPKIRGKQHSLAIEKVCDEVKNMVKAWIQEIILIAQDSVRYGMDLYWIPSLFKLLEEIEKISWDFTYRVLYMYPDVLTMKNLEKLKTFKKFIPYFDIPLQHISENILKRMGRFYDRNHIFKLLDMIKSDFPWSFVRTNFIIGFPWETEENFQELCEFIQEYKFDNIAFFEYHDEILAASSKFDQKVDSKTIRKRFKKIHKIFTEQQKTEKNKQENTWYVMDIHERENWTALIVRPSLHAPEIDGYDHIFPDDILILHDEWDEVNIWSKISYKTRDVWIL